MDLQVKQQYDTVRIPLDQPPTFTADTGGFWTQDQCYINCFPITNTNTSGEKETWITKRPGNIRGTLSLASVIGSSDAAYCVDFITITALNDVYVAAMYNVTDTTFQICQYRPVTNTTLLIGTITATSAFDTLFLTELTIANVATLGVVWNSADGANSKAYYSTADPAKFTASLIEITDTDFPPKRGTPIPTVGGFVQMNGTTYVMTNTGEIVNSDLNSITSWNSLGTIQAISYPDQGVGLIRYKHHLVAFGEDSIEFFNDVGNPAPKSPLQRTDQAFIKFGAITAKGIINVDDILYWVGRSISGGSAFYKLDGYTPVKISSTREETLISRGMINNAAGTGKLSCLTMLGQKQIFIGGATLIPAYAQPGVYTDDVHGISSTIDFYATLTYNTVERTFWGFAGRHAGSASTGTFPIGGTQYSLSNSSSGTQFFLLGASGGSGLTGSISLGAVYNMDISTYNWTDGHIVADVAGIPYCVTIQTNRFMFSNERRKRIHKVKAVFDFMYSNTVEPDTGSTLWFQYSKELGSPFIAVPTARSLSVPNTFGRYYINNLGSTRDMGLAIVSKNKMSMRLKAIEIDMSQGN